MALEMEAQRQQSIGDALYEDLLQAVEPITFFVDGFETTPRQEYIQQIENELSRTAKWICILSFFEDKYDVILWFKNIIEKPVNKFDQI